MMRQSSQRRYFVRSFLRNVIATISVITMLAEASRGDFIVVDSFRIFDLPGNGYEYEYTIENQSDSGEVVRAFFLSLNIEVAPTVTSVNTPDNWVFDAANSGTTGWLAADQTSGGLQPGESIRFTLGSGRPPDPVTGAIFGRDSTFSQLFTVNFDTEGPSLRAPGDANGDGEVNLSDFLILRANFGNNANFNDGDFNIDGVVDLSDFLILRNNFGSSSDVGSMMVWAATVPEPSAVALCAIACSPLCLRRQR